MTKIKKDPIKEKKKKKHDVLRGNIKASSRADADTVRTLSAGIGRKEVVHGQEAV